MPSGCYSRPVHDAPATLGETPPAEPGISLPGAIPPLAPAAGSATPRLRDRTASALEVFFCSGVPSQLLLALLLQGLGWRPFAGDGGLSLRYIAVLSLTDTLIVVTLALLFLRSRGESPRRVLLGARRVRGEALAGLALALPIALGVALLALALQRAAPWLHNVADNPFAPLLRDRSNLVVFAVVVVLAGGVREEVQRAFILHRFRQHLGGAALGLWLFSLAFGLGHLVQGYDAVVLTALLGLTWGAIYLRRGSLVAPMVSHALFNLLEVLRQALVS